MLDKIINYYIDGGTRSGGGNEKEFYKEFGAKNAEEARKVIKREILYDILLDYRAYAVRYQDDIENNYDEDVRSLTFLVKKDLDNDIVDKKIDEIIASVDGETPEKFWKKAGIVDVISSDTTHLIGEEF